MSGATSAAVNDQAMKAIEQMSRMRSSASGLINKLCDHSAYATDDEYQEIVTLVRSMRQFFGVRAESNG